MPGPGHVLLGDFFEMPADIYIKDRLSDRKPRHRVGLPLVLAIVLAILASVFAVIFGRSKADPETKQEVEEQRAAPDTAASTGTEQGSAPVVPASADNVSNSEVVRLLREGEQLVQADELLLAREKLLKVLELTENPVAKTRARKVLDQINIDLLLTPRKMPGKTEYIVKSGDTIERIAREHGTNIELVQKSNGIKGALIHPGQRLRIPAGDFTIVADKSENILTVTYNGEYFKTYRIGTGKHDKTPTGDTKVTDRIVHPTWWQPDGKAIPYGSPDNLLGTHWLALDIRGYGIHGTWEPETIGKHESEGCIRMHNRDIEELYTIIPIGTPVTIKD